MRMQSQSAMEYLMTYGWAILIIAVILGALYQVGVFNPYTFSPKVGAGACKVARGIVDGQVTSSKVGTCNNALPQYVASFPGVVTSNIVASAASLPTGSGARTMTAWVRLSPNNPGSLDALVWGGLAMGQESGLGTWTSSEVYFWGDSDDFGASSLLVPSSTWSFIAASYASGASTMTLYLDSSSQSGSLSALSTPSGTNIYFGGYASYVFDGDIANVQIYNTSLTSNELLSLYKEGIGGAPINTANLAGWWPFNGDAKDYSGNGNDGTVTGVTFTGSWMGGYSAP